MQKHYHNRYPQSFQRQLRYVNTLSLVLRDDVSELYTRISRRSVARRARNVFENSQSVGATDRVSRGRA